MPSSEPRGPRQIARAMIWSFKGLRAAWTHEASFRLEAYLCVIFFPVGLWLGQGAVEKAVLCGSLLLVLSAELLNSAIEAVVDKVSPEIHELAGRRTWVRRPSSCSCSTSCCAGGSSSGSDSHD